MNLKNAQTDLKTSSEHAEAEGRRSTYIFKIVVAKLATAQNQGKYLYLYCYISFLPARIAANSLNRICILVLFVRTAYPALAIMFTKNVLRRFATEILKIFKNIQFETKN